MGAGALIVRDELLSTGNAPRPYAGKKSLSFRQGVAACLALYDFTGQVSFEIDMARLWDVAGSVDCLARTWVCQDKTAVEDHDSVECGEFPGRYERGVGGHADAQTGST